MRASAFLTIWCNPTIEDPTMLRLIPLAGAKYLDLTAETSRRSGDRNRDCLAKIPTPGGFVLVLKLLLEL